MEKDNTDSARLGKDVMKDIRIFVANNGGSIRAVLEHGAIWVMSKGAKEYINKLKK
jgi:hypothetical protein